jgi:hypothetical protein
MKNTSVYPNLKLSNSSLVLFFVSAGIFFFSLFFGPLYVASDQLSYRGAYDIVYGLNLIEATLAYRVHLNGELVHFLVVWVASNLELEKDFTMAVFNSLLAYLIMRVCLQWRVSIYIAIAVVCTNFYLMVLYFAAERLKFGFIFLMLSLLYSSKTKTSVAFAMIAVFSHLQQILIYASIIFSSVMTNVLFTLKTYRVRVRGLLLLIGVFIIALMIVNVLGDLLLYKFKYYNAAVEGGIFLNIWKSLIFLILTLLYSTDRLKIISIFSILLLSTIIVGPERVNLISYAFFMYYALQYKRGVNAGVVLTSFYFGVKSIYFLLDVINTGQGFS